MTALLGLSWATCSMVPSNSSLPVSCDPPSQQFGTSSGFCVRILPGLAYEAAVKRAGWFQAALLNTSCMMWAFGWILQFSSTWPLRRASLDSFTWQQQFQGKNGTFKVAHDQGSEYPKCDFLTPIMFCLPKQVTKLLESRDGKVAPLLSMRPAAKSHFLTYHTDLEIAQKFLRDFSIWVVFFIVFSPHPLLSPMRFSFCGKITVGELMFQL